MRESSDELVSLKTPSLPGHLCISHVRDEEGGVYLPWFIPSIQGGNFSRPTCSLPLGPTDSWHRVWEELPCLCGTELELYPPPFCGLSPTPLQASLSLHFASSCKQLPFLPRVLTNNTPATKRNIYNRHKTSVCYVNIFGSL